MSNLKIRQESSVKQGTTLKGQRLQREKFDEASLKAVSCVQILSNYMASIISHDLCVMLFSARFYASPRHIVGNYRRPKDLSYRRAKLSDFTLE